MINHNPGKFGPIGLDPTGTPVWTAPLLRFSAGPRPAPPPQRKRSVRSSRKRKALEEAVNGGAREQLGRDRFQKGGLSRCFGWGKGGQLTHRFQKGGLSSVVFGGKVVDVSSLTG